MNSIHYLPIHRKIEILINKGYEGEYWDYKLEWHEKMSDLIKDIICFANTAHDENCYFIFGVNDAGEIIGMNKERRKQADILEAMEDMWFAGDNRPEILVETVNFYGVELDVLTVYNTELTPIYLKKNYGEMFAGCIYMRTGDKNTPNKGMADIRNVEKLWKKRFGLLNTPLDYILDRLSSPLEWKRQGNIYYNIYKTEYQLEILDDDDGVYPEFYAYAMTNERTYYKQIQVKSGNTVLDEYQMVLLDAGRYQAPVPTWGFIGYDKYHIEHKFTYKYYIQGSDTYKLYRFFLDSDDEEAAYANRRLMEVVLLYETEEEQMGFEKYIECHQEQVLEYIEKENRFSYIHVSNELDTAECKKRLHTGVVLNKLLKKYRLDERQCKINRTSDITK